MSSKISKSVKIIGKMTLICLGIITLVKGISSPTTADRIYAITITEIQTEYKKLQKIQQQFQRTITLQENTILQIVPFEVAKEETQPKPPQDMVKTHTPQVKTSQNQTQSSPLTGELIQKVNELRAKNNLTQLKYNEKLARSAQNYAQEMAQNNHFSHKSLNGSDFILRNTQAGYTPYSWMAENIAAGQKTPEEVIAAWLQSPPHRENMLHPKAQETGVGCASKTGTHYTYYWVQEFGAK